MRVSQTTGTPETATSHVFVVVEPLLSVCRGGLFHVRAAAGGGGARWESALARLDEGWIHRAAIRWRRWSRARRVVGGPAARSRRGSWRFKASCLISEPFGG